MREVTKVCFSHNAEDVQVEFFRRGKRVYQFTIPIDEAEEFCKEYTRQVWAAQEERAVLEEEDV